LNGPWQTWQGWAAKPLHQESVQAVRAGCVSFEAITTRFTCSNDARWRIQLAQEFGKAGAAMMPTEPMAGLASIAPFVLHSLLLGP